MHYAVSNWIYGHEPLDETVGRIARLGYNGIELLGEPGRYDRSRVVALCQQAGLAVTSILGWWIWGIPGRDPASADDAERKAAGEYLRACVDLAVDVKAPIVVVLAAPAGQVTPHGAPGSASAWKSAYHAEWDRAVGSMRDLAAYASGHGILLSLEPPNRYESFLVTNVEQGLRFLEETGADNLRLHLDTFHMNIEEADFGGAVRSAGRLLVNVHISDSNRQAPGRGHTDFTALMRALQEIGYAGALVLEPVPPGSDPLLAARMPENAPLREIYAREGIETLRRVERSMGSPG
jgi:D-psicose/D-tagatose/L-ribulose 3-epimerase